MKGALSWPFLRLYALTLCYFSANAILNVIIPLKGESLGASNTTIGIVMGAYLLTTMVFRPWAGQVIQRHGPVRVLRILLVVNGVALLLYAFTGMGGYFFARVLQGVCTAFFSMALQLGIIDALPDKDRSQGISMYSLCSYLPAIFGPLLAVGMWQSELNLFAMAMIAIAVLTGAIGYTAKIERQPEEKEGSSGDHPGTAMRRSMLRLFTHGELRRCSLIMIGASVVFGAVTTFVPLYAPQVTGGSAAIYLMIQAAVVVAARFLLKSRIPSDGRWRPGFVGGTLALMMTSALAISFALQAGAVLFYAAAALMGVAQALVYPTLTTHLSFVLPKAERNVLIGLFIATADLGVSLGSIVMGPIADLTGYSSMYLICAGLGAAVMLLALFSPKEAIPARTEGSNGRPA
ncbi:staphylopine family metallophore export MFS transporter CntE [Paenibacillus sp. 1P07SE]|uniref:staphylopine family metallophore export MFS transporter CntE n=1 Tax=Paenibacillus sp. 1P07SE TaxID=3132209 RepID=UPI0039A68EE3